MLNALISSLSRIWFLQKRADVARSPLSSEKSDLTSLPSGGLGGLRNAPPLGRSSARAPAKSGFDDLDSMFDDDSKPEKSKPKASKKNSKKVRRRFEKCVVIPLTSPHSVCSALSRCMPFARRDDGVRVGQAGKKKGNDSDDSDEMPKARGLRNLGGGMGGMGPPKKVSLEDSDDLFDIVPSPKKSGHEGTLQPSCSPSLMGPIERAAKTRSILSRAQAIPDTPKRIICYSCFLPLAAVHLSSTHPHQ
eukprot:9471912-Pyramimonas_sp.AAC.1